ncbi:putative ribonuclease H-like domain-containing protein [Tanacetum coccineum]
MSGCLLMMYRRITGFFLATKDETSGILKSFITEIENLVDKKVKIIRCDNGTEFKNRVMSEFYEKKGIKREYSISLNSKAFRVYSIRTRKIEESLHIKFLEDKPIIAGDRPKWLFDIDVLTQSMNYVLVVAGTNSNDFAGTKESFGAGHSNKETRSSQDYIVMPLWKDDSLFDSSSKNASDAKPQPSSDIKKKDDEGVSKHSGLDYQERPANNTQDDNDVGPSINTASINVNTGSSNINIVNPKVTTAPNEATYDDLSRYEIEVDMSNITTTYPISSTPNTRIHKDHSLAQVIGDIQSGVLIRGMTKTINDQGFISAVYKVKTYEDIHTCLFAFFLSQEEPKRIAKALSDSAWVEAMQEELLQNKKDERGIVIRNKERLVAQGYTQEEGINYDKVFSPVARIEAIRLFLAYASFMGFMVYQMDVKSDFLYGKIEEEVYVDDIIFGSTKKELCLEFEKLMHDKFQMSSMGELTFFLDIRTASTPVDTEKPLLKDSDGDDVDVHLYRSMIGSLMYLTSSRPDIMFTVCAYARFQVTPKVLHLQAVKRIFSDYARASLDKKSTTGGCQFLGCRLISWQCKKQIVVATSCTEAEYMAVAS